ncbi:hypothetical protein VL2_gp072 [Pseudomonas phage vB_PaeM_VL12]|uniref:Uncharacterized protein n=10 Tax=Nankokuvirus TaxID=1925779 RepID=F2W680_9CAUD|nr:hypothetical protein [Pseudomonas aeruginosa]YP_004306832.1 hypothetical protein KPP10_gp084 [Pseudomonas phage KPP10]YP_008856963.1 hypothetical protein X832_gp087 [Pseudomonas phage PAK_P5]YP_008857722.1 hypothetical protein PAK_P30087 [Pseudomonas phage PAK_P3]YP_008858110.1 hypothetical protein X837_gp087 [Pseudomonas phage CHA_P1]ADX32100.1 hypothetical protein P3_CHA0087 [Pseudomonas phage P3_CHA]QEM41012.1 hypothetical protein PAPJP_086 [Pseudomonas phage PAP-JP]QIQ63879.1 hypothet
MVKFEEIAQRFKNSQRRWDKPGVMAAMQEAVNNAPVKVVVESTSKALKPDTPTVRIIVREWIKARLGEEFTVYDIIPYVHHLATPSDVNNALKHWKLQGVQIPTIRQQQREAGKAGRPINVYRCDEFAA